MITKEEVQPFVDWILSKIISRKFIVFIVATIALWKQLISGTEWSVFAGVYVFGLLWLNHLEKLAEKRKQINDFRGSKDINVFEEE